MVSIPAIYCRNSRLSSFAQFTVVSVSPEVHSTLAVLNEEIRVTFSTDVDGSSLNGATFRVYGHQSGQISGVYSVDSTGMVGVFQPSEPYKPGEFISVVLTNQVLSVGGVGLAEGYHWEFAARPQYGAGTFALPTGSSSPNASVLYPTTTLRNPTSIYAGDLTGDAYPELAIANSSSPSVTIMLNSRGGTINVDNLYLSRTGCCSPGQSAGYHGGRSEWGWPAGPCRFSLHGEYTDRPAQPDERGQLAEHADAGDSDNRTPF